MNRAERYLEKLGRGVLTGVVDITPAVQAAARFIPPPFGPLAGLTASVAIALEARYLGQPTKPGALKLQEAVALLEPLLTPLLQKQGAGITATDFVDAIVKGLNL